ncbi:MAG: deoxyribose-phosphate aldolase [Planctomycetota bacterium]|nr:MAG: deoxyribose-phosphate aldolase [Planctomycetota bacterium]RLS93539.1 MAG: deoxyribose-phosphate aldolase [Planctomycetota bacterium]
MNARTPSGTELQLEMPLIYALPPRRGVDAIMATRRAESFGKRSIKASSKEFALRLAISMTDLTTLEGKDSPEKVRSLCQKAIAPAPALDRVLRANGCAPIPSVAAICVYPNLVATAREALAGSSVKIASVATGFPSGQFPLEVRLDDVRRAVGEGADEIDMVISRGAFLAGEYARVADEITQVRRACGAAHLKIILETGELETLDAVRHASDLAICAAFAAGPIADGEVFIKTSTGKVTPAATMPVVLVMLEAIRDAFRETGVRIGMKPAGGIRSAKAAITQLVMVNETLGPDWLHPHLFRFGASTLLNDLLRQIARLQRGVYVARDDFAEA